MIKTTVQSQSEQNKKYQVFLTVKGWHCECPAFLFDEKKKKFCKHIEEAYKKLEEKLIAKSDTAHEVE